MNNPDLIFECLETIFFGVKIQKFFNADQEPFFCVKTLKFFDADQGQKKSDSGSGMEKKLDLGSGIASRIRNTGQM